DIIAWVDRVERVASCHERCEIGDLLDMISICAPRRAPTFLKDAPHRVVKYLLRGAAGASIFAHRLLRVDRPDRRVGAGGAHGLNMPGGGRAHAIAEAERGLAAKRDWAEPG